MLIAPDIDPVAISLGPLKVHWYGLMYLVGFVGGWWLAVRQAKRPNSGWKPEEISDLLFNIILGVILGGRLGYVLFYNLPHYLDHPLEIFISGPEGCRSTADSSASSSPCGISDARRSARSSPSPTSSRR